jgi:hypothetical protein
MSTITQNSLEGQQALVTGATSGIGQRGLSGEMPAGGEADHTHACRPRRA